MRLKISKIHNIRPRSMSSEKSMKRPGSRKRMQEIAKNKNSIGGVIMGELESSQRAKEYAKKMKNCPRLLFSVAEGNTLCSAYIVSIKDLWWLKYPQENPRRAGFLKAKVYLGQIPSVPFNSRPRRPRRRARLAPCGADCQTCDLQAEYQCRGCPATSFYHE